MKAGDFAAWGLLAIWRMNEGRRGRRSRRLRRRAWSGPRPELVRSRRASTAVRKTRWGRPAVERVAVQKLRHCAGRDWGRSCGAFAVSLQELSEHLLRADQDAELRITQRLWPSIRPRVIERAILLNASRLVDATIVAGAVRCPYEGGRVNPRGPAARFTRKRDKTYFGAKAHLGST